jgi:hypothetical protein
MVKYARVSMHKKQFSFKKKSISFNDMLAKIAMFSTVNQGIELHYLKQ